MSPNRVRNPLGNQPFRALASNSVREFGFDALLAGRREVA